MLSELKTVAQWYKDEPADAWQFGEIIFNKEVCDALTGLGIDIEFQSSSAKITVKQNHCYVPSQYFLYALKVKPLALLLRRYMDVFEALKKDLRPEELAEYIESSSEDNEATAQLDLYSRDSFFRIFNNKEARLKAKHIINGSGSGTSVRSTADFFGSIILQVFPVPNVSSDILGRLVYELTCNPEVYDLLECEYSHVLPFFISAETGDELLLRLFFILSMKDNLLILFNKTVAERTVTAAGIDDLFLLSSTPVAGNQNYFEEPLTYLPDRGEFVHFRKGIMDSQTGLVAVNNLLAENYPGLEVRERLSGYTLCDTSRISDVPRVKGAINKIYYGAPGTGKSYQIEKVTVGHTVFRTVFHPDTQYSDFVGALKPCMGKNGVEYAFRPGPFTTAYIEAVKNPGKKVILVIEELNRAPAAAVFGELFQLLDRDEDGESVYSIDISDPDMLQYIDSLTCSTDFAGKLKLPSNLSILASMNSSDQAVMPMDTAFKRRWLFEYLPIKYNKATPGAFKINLSGNRVVEIAWRDFAEVINDRLTVLHVPEDRLLGHRFLSEQELTGENAQRALKGKLLVYLWDDVLRHGKRQQVFTAEIDDKTVGTFGRLAFEFDAGKPVFSEAVEERLVAKGREIPAVESSVQDEAHAE